MYGGPRCPPPPGVDTGVDENECLSGDTAMSV
jgi:hypothetical protein